MVSGKIGGRVNGKMGSAVRKAALMACAAWAVAGSASVALAQEQGAAAAQNDGSQLGDIIVTARRTQESLQATPVAVTALTGVMLDRLNVRDVVATAQFTPNLVIGAQPASITAASVYIRGIGNASPAAVSEQGVGIYLDGVYATLEWVDWFNNRRLLAPIGNIPPAEAEERYYAMLDDTSMAA